MAGRRPTNLSCRNGVFYFRGALPQSVNLSARVREVRISLRTREMSVARLRLHTASLAFSSLCQQIRLMNQVQAPHEDIRAAVKAFEQTLFSTAAPPPTSTVRG